MKKIHQAFTAGCAYAILTISLFYFFAAISGGTDLVLSPVRFFLLAGFGLSISFVNLGASVIKVNPAARESLRYLVILTSFILTVSLSGSIDSRAATIISVSAVFTLIYIVTLLLSSLVKRLATGAAGKAKKNDKPTEAPAKKKYKPLYGAKGED